jgi:hypothetical protein
MADYAQYDTWYSFISNNTNLWLSWSKVFNPYAYLYSSPKAMWFENVNGPNSGSMVTGDVVKIRERISGGDFTMICNGGAGQYVRFIGGDPNGQTFGWQLWADQNKTPGQAISLGQTLYVTNASWQSNNFLTQYSGEPQYLTIGGNALTFQIRSEGGGLLVDESDIKQAPKQSS